MSATFAILKATRSHFSPTIRTNPDERDSACYTGDESASLACGAAQQGLFLQRDVLP
jgi:hypothetical protein